MCRTRFLFVMLYNEIPNIDTLFLHKLLFCVDKDCLLRCLVPTLSTWIHDPCIKVLFVLIKTYLWCCLILTLFTWKLVIFTNGYVELGWIFFDLLIDTDIVHVEIFSLHELPFIYDKMTIWWRLMLTLLTWKIVSFMNGSFVLSETFFCYWLMLT